MKTRSFIQLAALMLAGLSFAAFAEKGTPSTFCRFVPERSDDFAWENDKIAFRAYGPALRKGNENSGIDCWLKRVDYPIINKWYGNMKEKSYHKDWGEGNDPYHVGSSRGCGGLGLWMDGKLVISNVFTEWEVVKCTAEESVFVLSYKWEYGGDTYTEDKKISIKLGDRLFNAVSTFKKNGEIAADLPIAVGLTTHDGKAVPSKNEKEGWIACWEKIEGYDLGTGVVMDTEKIDAFELFESEKKDESHTLLITKTDADGQVEYYAGYGWARANEITSSEQWNAYLAEFAKGL